MPSQDFEKVYKPKHSRDWVLISIFLIGVFFRLYGFRWGMPHYFHPDERQIMYQASDVKLDWDDLDKLNPHFFAYGSFPIYLLKSTVVSIDGINKGIRYIARTVNDDPKFLNRISHWFPSMTPMKPMTLTGRILSAFLSALTIFVVFSIARLAYNRRTALYAAAIFAFSVLSIQQAHYYVVDGPQSLIIALAMFFIIKIALEKQARDYYYAGIFIGLAMATKFSSLPIIFPYFFAHMIAIFRRRREGAVIWVHMVGGLVSALLVMTAVMPFWITNFKPPFQIPNPEWWRHIQEQSRMVRGVNILPYTIQYQHTAPFWYLIKNTALWSLGLPLGLITFIAFGVSIYRMFKTPDDDANYVILAWLLPMFIINSTFQVKFLRYTLPLLPFMAIVTGRFLYEIRISLPKILSRLIIIFTLGGAFLWAVAFSQVYRVTDTRVQASNWIYENIPGSANILRESGWDDALPVGTQQGVPNKYNAQKLEIYQEPDNERKAKKMAEKLEWGDLIILTTKRHYGSVLRVPDRYPISGNFYRSLFAERLGYRFVAMFENPPRLGPMKFRDETADESFSVYEHPKVAIFQKVAALTQDQIAPYLIDPPPEIKKMTYNDILTAKPVDHIGSDVSFPILRWIIALEIIGLIIFPMIFLVFKKFGHRGYPVIKIAGLLLSAYLCWLMANLHLLPFTVSTILFILALFTLGNGYLLYKFRDDFFSFIKRKWWSIAGYELLFLAVFAFFAFLRSVNPDIYWSESSMDFGFVTSTLRSEYFPPEDPWIAGESINYYYYGHYLAAYLTQLTGVEPSYGYNLFFATIPTLVALAIAGLLIALTRRIWVGMIGVIFTIIIGNLDGIVQVSQLLLRATRRQEFTHILANLFYNFLDIFFFMGHGEAHFRFFRSAHEIIEHTVHEFPYWSYNFMDLHAHTIATIVTSFILMLHLVMFKNIRSGEGLFGSGRRKIFTFLLVTVTFGAMIPTNSWDFPTHLIVILLMLVFVPPRSSDEMQKKYTAHSPIDSRGLETKDFSDSNEIAGFDPTREKAIISMDFTTNNVVSELHDYFSNQDMRSSAKLSETKSEVSYEENDPIEKANDEITNDFNETEQLPNSIEDEDDRLNQEESNDDPSKNDTHESGEKHPKPCEDGISEEPDKILEINESESNISQEDDSAGLIGDNDESIIDESKDIFSKESSKKSSLLPHTIGLIRSIGLHLWDSIREVLGPWFLVIAGSMFLYIPYFSHFSRKGMGIGFLHEYKQTTPLDSFLTIFGLFLFILMTQLIRWFFLNRKRRGKKISETILKVFLIIFVLGIFYGIGLFFKIDYATLLLSVGLIITIVSIFFHKHLDDESKFAMIFAFMALSITAGCELIFIKDFYQGGGHRRFNTIFKFYMQAWFFFAVSAAFMLSFRSKIRDRILPYRWRILAKLGKYVWNLTFLILVIFSLVFTVMGPISRRHHDTYHRIDMPLTLDGHAYMKIGKDPNLYRAIHWLNKNVKGQPVILEATGADYLYEFGKISANTGLPTVLGWWSHVDQREYNRSNPKIKRDIKTIYESLDIPEVLRLLRKYSVKYIFIGKTEKREYSEAGLEKFKELTDYMTPVYANPDVTIYRVNDYGLNVDFAKVAADSNALADLRERLEKKKAEEKQRHELEEKRRIEAIKNMPPKTIFSGGLGEGRGQFMEPRSLAVQSNGNIYVADFRNHRIQKFNPEGQWLTMWGDTGKGDSQFNDICDVAVDDSGVYVLDTFNNRVQKFTHEGKHISTWSHPSDNLFYPRGIIADNNGFIYVADTGNSRIVKMNDKGKFVKKWGRLGADDGELDNPIGLHIHNDRLYVCDTKNQRISIFDLEGRFINTWPVKGWEGNVFVEPYITIDNNNQIWISDPTAHKVRVYTLNGNLIETITHLKNTQAMKLPMGLAIDKKGQILVVLAHLHRIGKIDPASIN